MFDEREEFMDQNHEIDVKNIELIWRAYGSI
jgi:hypothetical protein